MKRKKFLAAMLVLALLVGLLPMAAYAADPAQGGETPKEEALDRLDGYIRSIHDNELDGILTEEGKTALDEYKLAVEKAKILWAKKSAPESLTDQELQKIHALLGYNGTKWEIKKGDFGKLAKKIVVKMEIVGAKTKTDRHTGKQYTTVNPANGTITVKTPVTGLVKDDGAPKRLYLNTVTKTVFDSAADSTTGATPKYHPKKELDAQYYTVEDKGNGTYEIHLENVPADFVILKPVIKVTFASETKAENGGMVFTQTTITEDDVPVTDLAKDYNGEAQKPTFGGQLVPDRDYTVSYSGSGLGANEEPKNAGTYTVTVTGKGNYTGSFSKTFTIKKVGREAPTGFTATAPTAAGVSDGKIQGTTTAMEFRKQGVQEWTPCPGTELQGLPAGTYEIRYTETTNEKASKPAIVEVPNPGAPNNPSQPSRPSASGGNYVPDRERTPERMEIPAENGKEHGYVQAPAGSVDPSTRLRITEKANGKRDVILVDANGNEVYSNELMLVTIPAPKGQQGPYRVKVNGVYTTFELSEDGKYVTMPVVFSRDGKMSEDVIVRQGGISVTGTYKALPGMYQLSVNDRGNTRYSVDLTDASGKKVHSNGPVMVSIPAPQGVGEVYRVKVDGKWTTFEVKDGFVRFAMVF